MIKDDKLEINHPKRYNADTLYECYKVLQAWMTKEQFQGYLRGNCLKYLCRLGKKDDEVQELGKCKWYLEKLMESYSSMNDKKQILDDRYKLTLNEEELEELIYIAYNGCHFSARDRWSQVSPSDTSRLKHYRSFLDLIVSLARRYYKKFDSFPNCIIIPPELLPVLDSFTEYTSAYTDMTNHFISGYIDLREKLDPLVLNVIVTNDSRYDFVFVLTNYKNICEDNEHKIGGSLYLDTNVNLVD